MPETGDPNGGHREPGAERAGNRVGPEGRQLRLLTLLHGQAEALLRLSTKQERAKLLTRLNRALRLPLVRRPQFTRDHLRELVSNAVRHAGTVGADLELRLEAGSGWLRLEVRDADWRLSVPRVPPAGKAVWAELAIDEAA